ncbi:hypothetical protein CC86DRAFT_404886 [Ophiobolus disseminans]|uniref:Uncharacterized protein n=1 Tax=Ophiobolus disseminans TaxID=1469910 RepID=A0A6A7A4U2_9PLEO|nr:hypothetical protein CC86DRAFT_404886 [Ophiobolus disseminans]
MRIEDSGKMNEEDVSDNNHQVNEYDEYHRNNINDTEEVDYRLGEWLVESQVRAQCDKPEISDIQGKILSLLVEKGKRKFEGLTQVNVRDAKFRIWVMEPDVEDASNSSGVDNETVPITIDGVRYSRFIVNQEILITASAKLRELGSGPHGNFAACCFQIHACSS